MAKLLLASGADVNVEATQESVAGLTPTQLAEDLGDAEMSRLLRSNGGITNPSFSAKRAAKRAAQQLLGPFLHSH